MVKKPLPINEPTYKDTSPESIHTLGDELVDGYLQKVEDRYVLIKRPGLGTALLSLPTTKAVTGLYWWPGISAYIAVSDGRIFKIERAVSLLSTTYSYTEITGSTELALNPDSPVSFAEWGDDIVGHKLFMANGARLVYIADDTATTLTVANAPDNATFVVVHDRYVIANDEGTSAWLFSNVNDYTTWSALDFAVAEAKPDLLQAILLNNEHIVLVGKTTTEAWYDDGVTPFSRAAVINHGTQSPYATLVIEDQIFLFDQKRQFGVVSGTSWSPISGPYNKLIQGLKTIEDAIAMDITVEGRGWYVVTFPSADITLAYDYKNGIWAKWGKWNSDFTESLNYNRFVGQCYSYSPDWGTHLVGSRAIDGKIYGMSPTNYKDDTNSIRTIKRSGNNDYGIKQRKRNQYLDLTFRRGQGTAAKAEAFCVLRFRDDGSNIWKNERKISLGKVGETDSVIRLHRLGIYKTRQYEIIHSDDSEFMLVEAEEEFDVLER